MRKLFKALRKWWSIPALTELEQEDYIDWQHSMWTPREK